MAGRIESFLVAGHEAKTDNSIIPSKRGVIFHKITPGTVYIYNSLADTSEDNGSISCGLMDKKTLQIHLNRDAVANFQVIVKQKVHELMPWTTIITKTYDVAGETERWVVVGEGAIALCVGVRAGSGTPTADDWITIGFSLTR